jgi:hypothetical protein
MKTIKVKAHATNKCAYPVGIKNKTTRTLSNGVVVPTWLAMTRKAVKV